MSTLLRCAVLLSAVLVAYVPAYRGGYIWDDLDHHLPVTQRDRTVAGLARYWFEPGATPQYYPLTHTAFWLESQLWGLAPLGYHVVNVVLHALNGVLLFVLLRRLGLPFPFVAALLFALHPVHVESVAWVSQRKNTLSGLFYLLALLSYLRFDAPDRTRGAAAGAEADAAPDGARGAASDGARGAAPRAWRRWGFWCLALLCFVLALLSKTVTCTLPAVIVVLLWWKRGGVSWRSLWPTLPLFAIGVGFAFVTIHLEKTNVGATGADWQLSTLERVLLAGRTSSFYAGKLVWPIPLMTVYPRWEVDARQAAQWLYPLGVLAVLAWLWFARGRLGRGALAAVLCFGGTLLPALGFFDVYPFRYSFVADHYAYLASIPIIALVVAAVGGYVRTLGATARFVGSAATAVLVLACGGGVWSRCDVYRDAFALWSDAVAKNPAAWVAQLNLGAEFQKRGDLPAALRHDEAAVRLKPTYPDAHYNYANDLQRGGRIDDAIRHFNEALRLRPDYADAHFNLAKLLAGRNQAEAALRHFGEAVAFDPNLLAARCDMALELLKLGRVDEAIRTLQEAVARDANADEAHYRLGIALCAAGRLDEGIAAYREAIRLQPANGGRRLVLARVLLAAGRPAAAVVELRESLARQPDQVDLLGLLAWTLATCADASVRNGTEAAKLAQRAVDLTREESPQALDALAAACAECGDFARALTHIRAAIELARRAGDESAAALYSGRMSAYERGQPWRE